MGNNAAENLGIVLAAIVGVSLALTQAVGPLLVYLTEAIKRTGKVKDGYAGVVTLVLGMVLGGALGGLTDAMSEADSYGFGTMVALGVFGGALMAAGAVKTYKAMGDVNTKTATLKMDASDLTSDPEPETMLQMRSTALASQPMSTTPLSRADIEAMQAELDAHDDDGQDPATPNVIPAPPLPPDATADNPRVMYADPQARK